MHQKEIKYVERSFKRDFVTNNKIIYTVSFDEELNGFFDYPDTNSYYINFYSDKYLYKTAIDIKKEYGCIEFMGSNIRMIIIDELEMFLNKNVNDILLFVCENKHGASRSRLFNIWYNKYGKKDFIKADNIIDLEGDSIYSSLIINKKNAHKKDILRTFKSINNDLNTK